MKNKLKTKLANKAQKPREAMAGLKVEAGTRLQEGRGT
jgi:hypothetical protein